MQLIDGVRLGASGGVPATHSQECPLGMVWGLMGTRQVGRSSGFIAPLASSSRTDGFWQGNKHQRCDAWGS